MTTKVLLAHVDINFKFKDCGNFYKNIIKT